MTPQPLGVGPVDNDGQKIVARPEALAWIFGEGSSSPATQIANYTLNGDSLAGSALACTKFAVGSCTALEILPTTPLVNGRRYVLALNDMPIGTFIAHGLESAAPHVTAMSATQYELTVEFDRPMLHFGACGASPWTLSVPRTISFVRSGASFPPEAGAYTSSSDAYEQYLAAFVSEARVSDDCTSVTLRSGWGAPVGTFDVTVAGIEDHDGNVVRPATYHVTIADEGPPKLMFAQLELQTAEKKVIRVAYSEAMDEEYVTDPERYYLNGTPIPADTTIECELVGCTWVRLTFAPSAFVYGAQNTLRIVGVRDTAGKTMEPDIATSGSFEVR